MAFYNNLPPYSLPTAPQFLWGDRSWSPLCALCVFRLFFHLGDLRFHRFYQLGEFFFTLLARGGVNILGYAFAIDSRRKPPLVEVVVYHRDAPRAALSYLGLVRLKNRFCGVFGDWLVTYYLGWLRFGHLCGCTADLSVDPDCRLSLHSIGDMTINVECGLGADVSYHGGQGLDIHTVFECHCSEGVAQIVEADFLALRPLQYLLKSSIE